MKIEKPENQKALRLFQLIYEINQKESRLVSEFFRWQKAFKRFFLIQAIFVFVSFAGFLFCGVSYLADSSQQGCLQPLMIFLVIIFAGFLIGTVGGLIYYFIYRPARLLKEKRKIDILYLNNPTILPYALILDKKFKPQAQHLRLN